MSVALRRCLAAGTAAWLLSAVGLFAQSGLMTREEVLAAVYPRASVEAERVFLTSDQTRRASELAQVEIESPLVARYVAREGGRVVGRAYVDTHVVRTKRESLLIALASDGTVRRIEVTAFLEPREYLAPDAWLRQFDTRPLTDEVALQRAIRPIAGATLDRSVGDRCGSTGDGDRRRAGERKAGGSMRRWERWSFNGLNIVVAITGLAYLYMKYLLASDDPFAVVNHPWQSSMLSLHVVAAPFVILLFGIVLRSHIIKKLVSNSRPDRRTGWISLISFSLMAVSGYLLQVATSVAWLNALVVTHIGTSTVFIVGYGAHLVIGWRILWSSNNVAAGEGSLTDTADVSF